MNAQKVRELLASLVVFLVALPLCMGIAQASGVPASMGLLSGIVGGIVVGLLAGSPLQVSGPAAGLIVIVYEILELYGTRGLVVVVGICGLMQILAGVFKFGQWFRAIAPAVLYAMLSGIGVIIIASQVHPMMDGTSVASAIDNMLAIPGLLADGFDTESTQFTAAGVGFLTLGILLGWGAIRPKLPGMLAVLPAPLLAVGIVTPVAFLLDLPVKSVTLPDNPAELLLLPNAESGSLLLDPWVWVWGLALAFVASAEALLSASAVDRLHTGPRTNFDKELLAQGVGNTVLGVIGGLPLTGVIVRSSANVQAGAQTRWSAVLHGIWLLGAVVLFPWLLQLVPSACLAAILVHIGFKLANPKIMVTLYRQGASELLIFVASLLVIVSVGLLQGLLAGLALSFFTLAWKMSHIRLEFDDSVEGRVDAHIEGSATFVGLPSLARELEKIEKGVEVHIHLDHLTYIDRACLELLRDWKELRQQQGTEVIIEWDELEQRNRDPWPRRPSPSEEIASAAQ